MNKTETLTSRERVLKALSHEPVDRVPIDLGMHFSTGISAFAYRNLREHLGLSTENIEIIDMIQFLARVQDDILKRFHCDCILLHPGWLKSRVWNPRGKYTFSIPDAAVTELQENGDWIVRKDSEKIRMPKDGYFFSGDWISFQPHDDEYLDKMAAEAERIYNDTEYFTSYIGLTGFFKEADFDWQCKMLTDPQEVFEENSRLLDINLKMAEKILKKMGKHIQGICLGGDLGSQTAPLIRPSVYEDLCAPFLKKLCGFIHENSDLKIFYHCCGAIKPMIPILIDCGIDALNPIQISADNMNPSELKKEFGDKLAFWGGGCDTQSILNNGTPNEVKAHVKGLINTFKQNSGYVFNQVHNIMGDVKSENIIAMFDTAYEESFF